MMNSSCNNSNTTLAGAFARDVVNAKKVEAAGAGANATPYSPLVDSIFEADSANVTAKCATETNDTPAATKVGGIQGMMPDSYSGKFATFNASEAVTECMAAVGGALRESIAIDGTSLGSQKIIFKGTDVELPLLFTLLLAGVYFYAWVFHDGSDNHSARGRYHGVTVRTAKKQRKRRRHKSKERFQRGNASSPVREY